MERCRSGLTGTPGERVIAKTIRGFESHPFRSTNYMETIRGFCAQGASASGGESHPFRNIDWGIKNHNE